MLEFIVFVSLLLCALIAALLSFIAGWPMLALSCVFLVLACYFAQELDRIRWSDEIVDLRNPNN